MKKSEILATLIIWLIVTITAFFYAKYFYRLSSIGEIIISISPVLIFLGLGILIFSRDKKIIKKAKAKQEFVRKTELNWNQALKHDVLIYLVPIIILILPFFFDQIPGLMNIIQAIIAFLALSYLRFIYWGEL